MRSNALYFPYISVPENNWTMKSLFYWDKLSAIVPMDHIERPEQMSRFMRALLERELVEQVFPSNYLYDIPEFESSFIEYLQTKAKRSNENFLRPYSTAGRVAAEKLGARVHKDKISPRANLHIEKLNQLPDYLIEEGLARRVDGAWLNMDTRVANMFMAYLAICLGGVKDVNAAPITSEVKYSQFLGHFLRREPRFNHRKKARDVVLEQLLPTPNEPINLDDLVKFKMKHGHLLPELRCKIEVETAKIALLENPDDRIDATAFFIEDCKEKTDEIVDAMKPSWSKISFGSIAPLFGSGLALSATGLNYSAVSVGSGLSFIGSAYQALNSIRSERKNAETMPLAYLAHARQFTTTA